MTISLFKKCRHGISLEYDDALKFVTCQWQRTKNPNKLYLAYRLAIALYFLTTLMYAIFTQEIFNTSKVTCMIYFTYWTYILSTIQASWAAALLFYFYCNRKLETLKTYSVYWCLQTIALDGSVLTTVYYWTLVKNDNIKEDFTITLFLHVLNSVIMTMDLFMVSHPTRLWHAVYSMGYTTLYSAFDITYYFAGGLNREGLHYIYKPLDWKKPGKASVAVVGTITFIGVIHIFFWGLHFIRLYLRNFTLKTRSFDKDEDRIYDQHDGIKILPML